MQEVIDTAERLTGRKILVVSGPCRDGDSVRLVADSRMSRDKLGW